MLLLLITVISPAIYWINGIGQRAAKLPAEISLAPDGSLLNSPKAEALHQLSLPLRLQRLIIGPLLLLAYQFSGGAVALRHWLEQQISQLGQRPPPLKITFWKRLTRFIPQSWRHRLAWSDLLVTLLFIIIFELALILINLPLTFYRGFILPHQFGLSTYSGLAWWSDWGKNVILTLLTDTMLWGGFYSLIRLFPRRWPIPGGALLFAVSLIFTLLTPILITPLFYEVRPLADDALRGRLVSLAERAHLTVDNVEVINASAKTTTVNAYVTSLGGAQRMVLYDTLIDGYTPDQVEMVVAHELGHWYYRHILWGVIGLGAAGWLGLFVLRWFLDHSWSALGWRGPADVAGWPTLLAGLALVGSLALPAENAISRYAEQQADQFALTMTGKPDTFISLFEQLAEQNLSLVDPPAWEKIIFYTHPSTNERVQHAKNFQNHP